MPATATPAARPKRPIPAQILAASDHTPDARSVQDHHPSRGGGKIQAYPRSREKLGRECGAPAALSIKRGHFSGEPFRTRDIQFNHPQIRVEAATTTHQFVYFLFIFSGLVWCKLPE